MTVEIYVKCDGRDCHGSREIEDDNDQQIEGIGWGIDDSTGFHYCPDCWEIVKKEKAEEPEPLEEKYCIECGEDKKFDYLATYANGDEWKCQTCGNVFMWDEEPNE